MEEREVKFLLYKASAAYPNQIELTKETVAVWVEHLQNYDFTTAVSNLDYHIDTSRFFPSISDIKGANREDVSNYDQLRIETAERFAEIEQWKQEAVPLPEHLIPKALKAGDADE